GIHVEVTMTALDLKPRVTLSQSRGPDVDNTGSRAKVEDAPVLLHGRGHESGEPIGVADPVNTVCSLPVESRQQDNGHAVNMRVVSPAEVTLEGTIRPLCRLFVKEVEAVHVVIGDDRLLICGYSFDDRVRP